MIKTFVIRTCLFLFCLYSQHLCAGRDSSPPGACPYSGSVNVITGEYCEAQTDLVIEGPFPFAIKRCFFGMDTGNPSDGLAWHFNHPNILSPDVGAIPDNGLSTLQFSYIGDPSGKLGEIRLGRDMGFDHDPFCRLTYTNEEKGGICRVEAADGRAVEYHYSNTMVSRETPGVTIDRFIDASGGETRYFYRQHPTERKQLINRCEYPGGSWIETEYYEGKHNNVAGTLVSIEDPLRDPRIGRIKLQKAPVGPGNTTAITQTFFYHDGYTEVVRANGQKTIYRYSDDHYLTATETFTMEEGCERLYKVERLFWSDNKESPARKLTSKTLEDGNGRVISCQTYIYNDKGNIVEEAFYGNITGTSHTPIILNANGLPENNGTECNRTYYEYTQSDEKSPFLLSKKIEVGGKTTRYKHDPITRKTVALFTCNGEEICLREFYSYNKNGLLIEAIYDNGNSEDSDDLAGATERRIVKMQLKEERTSYGMPEIIEEFSVDIASGAHHPTKTTRNHFSSSNKLRKQDVYDSEGNYAYSCNYDYDASGHCRYKEENNSKSFSYKYDQAGNLIFEKELSNEGTFTEKKRHYDLANRLVRSVETDDSANETTTVFHYDNMNQKTASIDTYGNEMRYSYDSLGRMTKIFYPSVLNANDQEIHPTVENRYDIHDNVIATIDPNGYMTRTIYSVKGNPLVISHCDGTEEHFEYFLDGSLRKKTEKNGITTVYTRDFLARIIAKEVYNASGQLIATSTAEYNAFRQISSTDANGVTSFYEYDATGKLSSVTVMDEEGVRKKEFEYDALGRLTTQKEWYGDGSDEYRCLITERDSTGRTIETRVENASGVVLRRKRDTEKDENKSLTQKSIGETINDRGQKVRLESTVDSLGITTSRTFDALGRIEEVSKTDSFGGTLKKVSMRYDAAGNKVKESHTLLGGSNTEGIYVTTWTYGPGNRLESVTEGEGSKKQRKTTYHYNTFGQVDTILKPDGVLLSQNYNKEGLVSRLTSSDGTVDLEYYYDQAGNIVEAIDKNNGKSVQRFYNASNRLAAETQTSGSMVTYDYDKCGRKQRLTLPDGSSVAYRYDAVNLKSVERYSPENKLAYQHQYSKHDLEGRSKQSALIKNLGTINYKYDEHGRCHNIDSPFWSETTLWSDNNDGSSMPLEVVVSDPLSECRTAYGYDTGNRVAKENGDIHAEYTYDSIGNRQSSSENSYSINNVNEVNSDGIAEYSYDANGNMVKIVTVNSTTTLHYDALNRLIEVLKNQSLHIRYSYDAFNRRTEKEFCNTEQHETYLYDGDNEIGTLDASGNITSLRILAGDGNADIGAAIAIEKEGHLYAPIHDRMGSVRCLLDAESGTIQEFYRFTAFGEEKAYDTHGDVLNTKDCINAWRFRSKRCDTETGFLFFGKRFYAPSLGRWTTLDPLGHQDGANRFLFVHNNPMMNQDSYGLFSFSSLWNGLIDGLSTCWNFASNIGEKLFGVIRAETHYFQEIRPSMTEIFEKYFGKGFLTFNGYYTHPMESGVYGQGEVNNNVRITLINGIANIRSYYRGSLEMINKTHGGTNIHYIFRPTEGWCNDLVKAMLIKFGYVSPYARELASTWKKLIDDMGGIDGGGTIIHYCHSLGGTDTATAVSLLTPAERKMIQVYSLGSATMIKDNLGFQSVSNFVSVRDGVCLFDPVGYIQGLFSKDSNVIFIGTFLGLPLIDHSLEMTSYSEQITDLGRQFMQMYACAKGFIY